MYDKYTTRWYNEDRSKMITLSRVIGYEAVHCRSEQGRELATISLFLDTGSTLQFVQKDAKEIFELLRANAGEHP
jgi:hypothetical protein